MYKTRKKNSSAAADLLLAADLSGCRQVFLFALVLLAEVVDLRGHGLEEVDSILRASGQFRRDARPAEVQRPGLKGVMPNRHSGGRKRTRENTKVVV